MHNGGSLAELDCRRLPTGSRPVTASSGTSSWPRPLCSMAVELGLLNLVEQRPVTDAEELSGLNPVPLGLLEDLTNRLALRHLRAASSTIRSTSGASGSASSGARRPGASCICG